MKHARLMLAGVLLCLFACNLSLNYPPDDGCIMRGFDRSPFLMIKSGESGIECSWTDIGASDYVLYYREGSFANYTDIHWSADENVIRGIQTTAYTLRGLKPNTAYSLTVDAHIEGLMSGYSNIVQFTTGDDGAPFPASASYAFRFSVNNRTETSLYAKLIVGTIPAKDAGYTDFKALAGETGIEEEFADRGVPEKNNSYVLSYLPLLCLPESQDAAMKDLLMNKLISFVLTIRVANNVIYRIAGWDVPQADMERCQIDEKLYGYYDTAEDCWAGKQDGKSLYPLLYSKLWNGPEAAYPKDLRYYITVNSLDSIQLHGFAAEPDYIGDDEYWNR